MPTENKEPAESTPVDPAGSSHATAVGFRWINVFTGLAVAACLPTWLSLGARWWWVLDLATCFVWWYSAAGLLFLVASVAMRQGKLAAFVCVTFLINALQLAPYEPLRGSETASPGEPQLRVTTINVLTSNRSFDRVLRLIEEESPDVVVLLEVDQQWADAMAPLTINYPHQAVRTRSDNFGVAFYSRLPTESINFRELTPNGTPNVIARLTWNQHPLTILGAHPVPPMSRAGAASRNADLTALAKHAADQTGEVILMGDFNVTPFSPHFRDLLSISGLRDTAAGRGAYATWGTPRLGPVIPIDHVLHTPGLKVLDRRVGPNIGSDHLPITVDFSASRAKSDPAT